MQFKNMTVRLPKTLYDRLVEASKRGERSRTDIVREALARYFGMPEEEPSPEERAAIEEGLEDQRHGRETPAFDSAEDFARYRRTGDYKKLVESE